MKPFCVGEACVMRAVSRIATMEPIPDRRNGVYYVAFVEQGEAYRVISLRRATRCEVKHYVESC